MNIKILDSWLREYLKTNASPKDIAEKLSLTSLSVEKVEKIGNDFLYEMEITTNRSDLFSVLGIARETSAVLSQFGIEAKFLQPSIEKPQEISSPFPILIQNDPKLVNRISAVVMEVKIGKSPQEISNRLESSGIRSLNNVIDTTNYVMRTIGHPTHVFDFDRLDSRKIKIREARKGEKIITLDGKNYNLLGGEIVAVDDRDKIVDLLGIMGLENSVVTDKTKKILYFIDNNDKSKIRQASMENGIRTDAAALNEKGIDPNLTMDALFYGIKLFKENAKGIQVSKILDIYDNRPKEKTVSVSFGKINKLIGVRVEEEKSIKSLEDLGFKVDKKVDKLTVNVPSFRLSDIENEEDLIEEIARIYGYYKLPSILPQIENSNSISAYVNQFYFEQRIKNAMKYWGYTETYTYSFISEDMYQGPIDNAVEIANPLNSDFVYMRNSLIPSLLQVVNENKNFNEIRIFEIANVYLKSENKLPKEALTLSGVLKKEDASFYEIKGLIEQLTFDLGIKNLSFKKSSKSSLGAGVFIEKGYLGEIEILDSNLIDFELNFEMILKYANVKREFIPFAKFPPVVEDLTLIVPSGVDTEQIIESIKVQDDKIVHVAFTGSFQENKSFHIIYQDREKNLTKKDVLEIRSKVLENLEKKLRVILKS